MNIEQIENNLDLVAEDNYRSVIEIIVEAVRVFPVYELMDTEDYFTKVREILKLKDITYQSLRQYLHDNSEFESNDSIWIADSLNSLSEAFDLMRLYSISFDEVRTKIESLRYPN